MLSRFLGRPSMTMNGSRAGALWAAALVFALVPATSQAKQAPAARGPERIPDGPEASLRIGNARISSETGAPLALYRVGYAATPGDATTMARQFLKDRAQQLMLRSSDLAD